MSRSVLVVWSVRLDVHVTIIGRANLSCLMSWSKKQLPDFWLNSKPLKSCPVTPISQTLFANDVKRCKDWSISIDLYLTDQSDTIFYSNIFYIQAAEADGNDLVFGARLPALFARYGKVGEEKINIYVCTDLNDNFDYGFEFEILKFTWTNIKIREIDGLYSIAVNNEIIHSALNNIPREWASVSVEMAKQVNMQPTEGNYRNFWFDLC